MSLNKTLYPLLSTGSTQKTGNCPDMTDDFFRWDVKHQHKQANNTVTVVFNMYYFSIRNRHVQLKYFHLSKNA